MNLAIDFLFRRTWWEFPGDGQLYALLYHYFNLFEALVWLVLGAAVAVRYWRHRNSRLELAYAAAFIAFAASDVVEAWLLASWLLWVKLAILVVLFSLRRYVRTTYYPLNTLY